MNEFDDNGDAVSSPCSIGFLYIMTNKSMLGTVKIGFTNRCPHVRAAELSGHTGVPFPFRVLCYYEVSDCLSAESTVHAALSKWRINSGREFFKMTGLQAVTLIEDHAGQFIRGKMVENFEKCQVPAPPPPPPPIFSFEDVPPAEPTEERPDWYRKF